MKEVVFPLCRSPDSWVGQTTQNRPNRRKRLIVVSNRLPAVFSKNGDGGWRVQPGSGGLITALVPVLKDRGGIWIGWPGTTEGGEAFEDVVAGVSEDWGYTLKPVMLTPAEIQDFYNGCANEILWPLFHDLQSICNFEPRYWQSYREVNRRFAEVIGQTAQEEDFIWIHDYHLMYVAAELRRLGVTSRIGFFLHIPFPPLDMFLKLPWRMALLQALLECDLIGLQTLRDRRNLVQCLQFLVRDVRVQGKGQVLTATLGDREVKIGHFPISIDYNAFLKQAAAPVVAEKAQALRARLSERKLIFSVDRLDYTKGIPCRLQAFKEALARYPKLRGRVTLFQVVVPSRVDIPEYARLKSTIEQLIGGINGEWAKPGEWLPVWYVFGHLTPSELAAYYRAADIALVTPLKDGMNLVAKEYCTCNLDGEGVLILSEFAGASAQLRRGALLVNPYDIEGVAEAIYRAWSMKRDERRARMRLLQRSIRRHDIFWWADGFLRAAFARDATGRSSQCVKLTQSLVIFTVPSSPGRVPGATINRLSN